MTTTAIKTGPSPRPRRIVHVYRAVQGTENTALRFSILLAVDKGYASEVYRMPWGHRVLDTDGRAVDFRGSH